MSLFLIDSILGLDERHVVEWKQQRLHPGVIPALEGMRDAAAEAGFELAVASGFRSFERQLAIWNGKALGHKPLLADDGSELLASELGEEELLHRILRWSALPGASRHHWGTDFDVYDAGPVKAGYSLQLTVEETLARGVFGGFYQWLDEFLARQSGVFFRPYPEFGGGVAAEPWHLSYAPLARTCQQQLSVAAIREQLDRTDIALKPLILEQLDAIFERYIWVPWVRYEAN